MGSFLDGLISGTTQILDKLGNLLPVRPKVQYLGDTVTVVDDMVNNVTKVTIAASADAGAVTVNASVKLGITGSASVGQALVSDPADPAKVKVIAGKDFRGIVASAPVGGKVEFYPFGSLAPQSVTLLPVRADGRDMPGVVDQSTLRVVREEFPHGASVIAGLVKANGSVLVGAQVNVDYHMLIDLSKYIAGSRDGTNPVGPPPPEGHSWSSPECGRQNSRAYNRLLARCRNLTNVAFIAPPYFAYFAERLCHDGGKYGFLHAQNFQLRGTGGLIDNWIWNGPDIPDPIGEVYLIPANGGETKNVPPVFSGTPTKDGPLLLRYTDATHFVYRVGCDAPTGPVAIGSAVSLSGTGLTVNISAAVDIDEVIRVQIRKPPTTSAATPTRVGASTGTLSLSGTPSKTHSIATGNPIRVYCLDSGSEATALFAYSWGEHLHPHEDVSFLNAGGEMPLIHLRPPSVSGTTIVKNKFVVDVEVLSTGQLGGATPATVQCRINGGAWSDPITLQAGRILTDADGWTETQQIGWTMSGIPETSNCDVYFASGTYTDGQTIAITRIVGIQGSFPITSTGLQCTPVAGTFEAGDFFTIETTSQANSFMHVGTGFCLFDSITLRTEGTSTITPWDETEGDLPKDESPGQPILTQCQFIRCGAQSLGFYTNSGQYPRDCFWIGRRMPTVTIGPFNTDFFTHDRCFGSGFGVGYVFNQDNDSGQAVGNTYKECVAQQCFGAKRIVSGQFHWINGSLEDIFGPGFKIVRIDRVSNIVGVAVELCDELVDYSGNSSAYVTLKIDSVDMNVGARKLVSNLFALGGSSGNIEVTNFQPAVLEGHAYLYDVGFGAGSIGQISIKHSLFPGPAKEIIRTPGGGVANVFPERCTMQVCFDQKIQGGGYSTHLFKKGPMDQVDLRFSTDHMQVSHGLNRRDSCTHEPIENPDITYDATGSATIFHIPLPYLDANPNAPQSPVRWKADLDSVSGGATTTEAKVIQVAPTGVDVELNVAPGAGTAHLYLTPRRARAAPPDPLDWVASMGAEPALSWSSDAYLLSTVPFGAVADVWKERHGAAPDFAAPGGSGTCKIQRFANEGLGPVKEQLRNQMSLETGEDVLITKRYFECPIGAASPIVSAASPQFTVIMSMIPGGQDLFSGLFVATTFLFYWARGAGTDGFYLHVAGTDICMTEPAFNTWHSDQKLLHNIPAIISIVKRTGDRHIVRVNGVPLTWTGDVNGAPYDDFPTAPDHANTKIWLGANAFLSAQNYSEIHVWDSSVSVTDLQVANGENDLRRKTVKPR